MRHESEDEIPLTTDTHLPWYSRVAKSVTDHFRTNRHDYERFFVIGGWTLLGIALTFTGGFILYLFAYMIMHYY